MRINFYLVLLTLMFADIAALAKKKVVVEITKGSWQIVKIGIPDLQAQSNQNKKLATQITKIIRDDLSGCGLIKPISPQSIIVQNDGAWDKPEFDNWRALSTSVIIVGQLRDDEDNPNKALLDMHLYDVFSQKKLFINTASFERKNFRRLSHVIANTLYNRLTGRKGYFDAQVVYVKSDQIGIKKAKRYIATMDYDGYGHRHLTNGKSIVMTPMLSPDGKKLAYVSFDRGNIKKAKMYIKDMRTRDTKLVGVFSGMSFSPSFSADSKTLAMSISNDQGSCSVWIINLKSNKLRRLTYGNVIDVSPHFSPDGKQICFNSDRSGSQQIYTINVDGSGLKRVSFGQGRYATPRYSRDGKNIAFIKTYRGNFYVGIMNSAGYDERLLTRGEEINGVTAVLDDLSWISSTQICFTCQLPGDEKYPNGYNKIKTISITGYNEQFLPTPNQGMSATWSPHGQVLKNGKTLFG